MNILKEINYFLNGMKFIIIDLDFYWLKRRLSCKKQIIIMFNLVLFLSSKKAILWYHALLHVVYVRASGEATCDFISPSFIQFVMV